MVHACAALLDLRAGFAIPHLTPRETAETSRVKHGFPSLTSDLLPAFFLPPI
jgi:hypothetical protein